MKELVLVEYGMLKLSFCSDLGIYFIAAEEPMVGARVTLRGTALRGGGDVGGGVEEQLAKRQRLGGRIIPCATIDLS